MPVLISPDGRRYRTEQPAEITRLRNARYTVEGEEEIVTVDDTRFHPGDHKVEEVAAYVAEHPEDAARVIAEEKAGKARTGIVGG